MLTRWGLRAGAVACALGLAIYAANFAAAGTRTTSRPTEAATSTATPIKHLVVIFQENVSFDHYFGTYPHATNTNGQRFVAKNGTPTVNGLTPALLHSNPNQYNPRRLGPQQAYTCDQDHDYTPEQQAFDEGLMDQFVQHTETASCSAPAYGAKGLVMDYYDGNTVTALWNYAQRFAMNDNAFGTTFGPSTPGALNLVAGQTAGATAVNPTTLAPVSDPTDVPSENASDQGTIVGDLDPAFDDCSTTSSNRADLSGPNIGEALNRAKVTWGWFEGGFRPSSRTKNGAAVCDSQHKNIAGVAVNDYSPHHEPFQYYAATANPHHLPPTSVAMIGHTDRANHQYDLSDFYSALKASNLPSVSFLKAAKYQDGHADYSDPLDEQHFLVTVVNALEKSKYWSSTAIVITYDDSDGWYDHVMPTILDSSADPTEDALNGTGVCGRGTPLNGQQDRCGPGPRLPFLVISPYSRVNYVDATYVEQASVLSFVENNWLAGRRLGGGSFDARAGGIGAMFDWSHPTRTPLILSPTTGEPATG